MAESAPYQYLDATGVVVAGAIEVGLAAAAWIDLARRPSTQVNGPKPAWAAAIAVNVIGPLCYFRWGRRRPT